MDNHSEERREYFRIDDKAIYNVSKLPAGSSLKTLSENNSSFLLGSSISRIDMDHQAIFSKIKRSSPDVAIYLDAINQKIQLVSNYLLNNDPEIKNLIASDINLSASGIAFKSIENLQLHDMVQIKLVLLPELAGVLCIGQVKRIENSARENTLHIDFTEISEADQELIIKHNMALQLEQARAKNHDYD